MTKPSSEQLIESLNDCIHIWRCQPSLFPQESVSGSYYPLMNENERARYHRFRFEKDRLNHLLTRALIRTTLSRYVPAVEPMDWRFSHNPYGKPLIANSLKWSPQFNISHSNDLIVVAISKNGTIGVDVENIKERKNIDGLIDFCFNEEEIKYIKLDDDEDAISSRFFELWTLKESYMKADGKGLAIGLKEIFFTLDEGEITFGTTKIYDEHQPNWNFFSSKFLNNYALGITSSMPIKTIKHFTTSLDL